MAKVQKECRHKWRVGSKNAELVKGKILATSINIWCEKCNKKIKASLFPDYVIRLKRRVTKD